MRLACKKAPWVCICCVRMYGVCICVLDWARHAHRFWMKKVLHTWRYKSYTNLIPLIRILYKIYLYIVLFSSIGYSFNLNNSQFHQFLVARPTLQQHMETEILQLFSSKKEMPARQTIPKDPGVFLGGINPTIILLWGWDWDYQTYFSERSGFLGLKTSMFPTTRWLHRIISSPRVAGKESSHDCDGGGNETFEGRLKWATIY